MATLVSVEMTFGILEIHCKIVKIHEILGPCKISVIFEKKSRLPAAILEKQVRIFEKNFLRPLDNSFSGKVKKFHHVISYGSEDIQQKVRGGPARPLVRNRVNFKNHLKQQSYWRDIRH